MSTLELTKPSSKPFATPNSPKAYYLPWQVLSLTLMQINSEFGDVGTLRCDILRDSDLNPAFISAFSALAGAAIGVVVSNLCIHSRPIPPHVFRQSGYPTTISRNIDDPVAGVRADLGRFKMSTP